MPQRTKLNPCEIIGTRHTILSLCVPSIGHLAFVIELIWTLQWSHLLKYSEQKNCPTKGQISLVRQIAAQITKVNPWETSIA